MAIAALVDWLAGLPAPLTVAMETTLYWASLGAQLEGAGYTARVAHA